MACAGLASSGSNQAANSNSGSEEDQLQAAINQRKLRRKQSNRESARRSRMRKQQRMDDLAAQVSRLRKENGQILTALNVTAEHYVGVEAENSVLRAQAAELTARLKSLNEIGKYYCLYYMEGSASERLFQSSNCFASAPWSSMPVDQLSIAEMLQDSPVTF